MTSAGIPVPPGFAITAYAYKKFIEETDIAKKIYVIIDESVTDKNDPAQYEVASKKIRELIESTAMPKEIENAVRNAYEEMNRKLNIKDTFVAVRSSATAEDLADASFAGQQETFLNIRGVKGSSPEHSEMLVQPIHSTCDFFIVTRKVSRTRKSSISVGVQKMVNSRAAGVMFTLNPVTGDLSKTVIEGN